VARRIPENRFDELVRRATEVFIARGYRLTQMSDIAEAVGVAKGTLYGYVESKDALMLLCLGFADQEKKIDLPEVLPLTAPAPGTIGEAVRAPRPTSTWTRTRPTSKVSRNPAASASPAPGAGRR
jgi:AcrR family transcriptional regulator